jgi:hypothetical protein
MSDVIIRTGCLPYDDGSGYEINIHIEKPNSYFDYNRVILNPDSEFTDFPIEKWPEVRDAIDRAINALKQLSPKEGGE